MFFPFPSRFFLLQNKTPTTTAKQQNSNNNNDHLDGPASCKWSSGWTVLLQMIIRIERPLVKDQNSNMRFALLTWSSFQFIFGKVNGASPYTHYTLTFSFDLLFSLDHADPLSSPKMSSHFIFIPLCASVELQWYRKEEVTCASCNHEAQEAKAQCWLQSPRTRSRDLNPIWSRNRNGSQWVVLSLIDGE